MNISFAYKLNEKLIITNNIEKELKDGGSCSFKFLY